MIRAAQQPRQRLTHERRVGLAPRLELVDQPNDRSLCGAARFLGSHLLRVQHEAHLADSPRVDLLRKFVGIGREARLHVLGDLRLRIRMLRDVERQLRAHLRLPVVEPLLPQHVVGEGAERRVAKEPQLRRAAAVDTAHRPSRARVVAHLRRRPQALSVVPQDAERRGCREALLGAHGRREGAPLQRHRELVVTLLLRALRQLLEALVVGLAAAPAGSIPAGTVAASPPAAVAAVAVLAAAPARPHPLLRQRVEAAAVHRALHDLVAPPARAKVAQLGQRVAHEPAERRGDFVRQWQPCEQVAPLVLAVVVVRRQEWAERGLTRERQQQRAEQRRLLELPIEKRQQERGKGLRAVVQVDARGGAALEQVVEQQEEAAVDGVVQAHPLAVDALEVREHRIELHAARVRVLHLQRLQQAVDLVLRHAVGDVRVPRVHPAPLGGARRQLDAALKRLGGGATARVGAEGGRAQGRAPVVAHEDRVDGVAFRIEAAVGGVAHAEAKKRELLVRGQPAVGAHVLQLLHVRRHLLREVPWRRDGRVEHHERDLEAARVRVRVRVAAVEGLQRVPLLVRERAVARDRIDELDDRVVLAREHPEQQQVERARQRGRRQERERHVDGEDVVRVLERLVPPLVGAVEHEFRREGDGCDDRPHGRDRGHQHGDLAVGVR
eukprot:2375277-Prymnesium_polylepis.2